MSNSVELCPMPFGMPAVRYMAPTARPFLASLASFISSTVNPSSANICTPALAVAPSSHSRKWRLWLTAEGRKETQEREEDRRKMLIHWNAYQCHWSTTEPQPDGEIISTMEPVFYFVHSNRYFWRNCRRVCLWHYCMVTVLYITDKTTTQAGAAGRGDKISELAARYRRWKINERLLFFWIGTFSFPLGQQDHLLHILIFSFDYLWNLLRMRGWFRLNRLYHRFWSSVLKPAEPLACASGFKGRVRLARNTLTNALMVLPYLTFQSCIYTHTHTQHCIHT